MPPESEIIQSAAARFRQGEARAALDLLAALLESEPQNLHGLVIAGQASFALGEHVQAAEFLERAVAVASPQADLLANLSAVYLAMGRVEQAATQARRALAASPQHFGAHLNLGLALLSQQRYDEAGAALDHALQLRPGDHKAKKHYARARYHSGGEHLGVRELLEQVVAREPEDFESRALLADLYIQAGETEAGIRRFRDLLQPDTGIPPAARSRYHSAMLIALQYLPGSSPAELLEEHRAWADSHAISKLPQRIAAPREKLRVGWVSPRFAAGPVANFFLPVLTRFDPSSSEHYLYSAFNTRSAVADRFRSYASVWRDLDGMAAEQAAQLIADDELDILVDLAGHAPGGQLRALTARPARVMVSWMDSFCTTGLAEMDYFISDPWLSPPGDEQFFTEKLVRLEGGRLCYRPYVQVAQDGLVKRQGAPVFACFNRMSKFNQPLLHAWAEILSAVPDSRLVLRNSLFDDPRARDFFLAQCRQSGLPADRVEMAGSCTYAEILEAYRSVDIALDPHPFSGCTSSCDALWMGVPVITCRGETLVSRQTAAMLATLGMDELARDSLDDYVESAVSLAGDPARLAAMRKSLRGNMEKAHDPQVFADRLLALLRKLASSAGG